MAEANGDVPLTRVERQPAHAAGAAQAGAEPTAVDMTPLLAWYRVAARALPWRRATPEPYAVWLSEVMLQQTRVDTVIPYYQRFLERFPTVGALADAPEADVLAAWSGLGYYRRARMLHQGAREIAAANRFPSSREELLRVSGVGPYTAGAIASIAFGEPAELVDGNVARVLARVFALTCDVKSTRGSAEVWAVARRELRRDVPGEWNQALMELGATVCTLARPACPACPLVGTCRARAQGLEGELPRAAKKAPPREERRVALVATNDAGDLLLGQRRPELRFGGMWEPPSTLIATPADERAGAGHAVEAPVEALLATPLGGWRDCGIVVHVLSHRRLVVKVLSGRFSGRERVAPAAVGDYAAFAWVEPDELKGRGVSTLARKLLTAGAS